MSASSDNDILKPTPQEEAIIKKYIDPLTPSQALDELKEGLQLAVEVELATIPIYLYTYYSIERKAVDGLNTGGCLTEHGIFANKAAGVIMSVAVEEMLHMSLSSNILFSLGGFPKLYLNSPGPPSGPSNYPVDLPHHNPIGPDGRPVQLPLSKFSTNQMWQFLEIEYPKNAKSLPESKNWQTIGQLYDFLVSIIKSGKIQDSDFGGAVEHQIQPDNYSPNNIDTAHPTEPFGPWGVPAGQGKERGESDEPLTPTTPTASAATEYSNEPDSHEGPTELITISSRVDALEAIKTITDQGEGYATAPNAQPDDYDDPATKSEDSHYYKFLKLMAHMTDYHEYRPYVAKVPAAPDPIRPAIDPDTLVAEGLLVNFPDNPVTRKNGSPTEKNAVYPEGDGSRAWSDFCNGVYQYMLILTETIFKVDGDKQKLFFNRAMHRSMIWVLDKLIQSMRRVTVNIDGTSYALAPTFENYQFPGATPQEQRANAYDDLLSLARKLKKATAGSADWISSIKSLPDVRKHWS